MRRDYLLGYQHIIPLGMVLHVCASASPPILPGARRCRPRAPAEFRGIGVEVIVTASLHVSHHTPLLCDTFNSRSDRGPLEEARQQDGVQLRFLLMYMDSFFVCPASFSVKSEVRTTNVN